LKYSFAAAACGYFYRTDRPYIKIASSLKGKGYGKLKRLLPHREALPVVKAARIRRSLLVQ